MTNWNRKIVAALILLIALIGGGVSVYFLFYRERLPSSDSPYFLKVHDFRYYPEALEAKKRLKGYPSFVMPLKRDDGIWFRVGIGPTNNKSDIEKWQKKLEDKNVPTEMNEYEEVKEIIIEDSGSAIKESKNWFDAINKKEVPPALKEVQGIITEIPYSKDYKIVQCAFAVSKYLKKGGEYRILLNSFHHEYYAFLKYLSISTIVEVFDQFIFVNYFDPVVKSGISVFIGYLDNSAILKQIIKKIVSDRERTVVNIQGKDVQLEGFSFEPGKGRKVYVLQSHNALIFAESIIGGTYLEDFLSTIGKTQGLLEYLPLKDVLFSTIPVEFTEVEFVFFDMSEIEDTYVISKNYAEWAVKMKGYWTATTLLHLNEGPLLVELFDLIGEDYSSSVYEIFSKEKRNARRTLRQDPWYSLLQTFVQIYVVPVDIKGRKGWYIDTPNAYGGRLKEISFQVKHYIVAVDTMSIKGRILKRKVLESTSESLQLF